ncbi:hypothetical protein [Streptomyces sp. NPDC127105]|uniref:hypothetical protein n=1 Tax=Streptomyces sp. NPDC127105 TaxID=3345359 RepID=UPI00365F6DCB
MRIRALTTITVAIAALTGILTGCTTETAGEASDPVKATPATTEPSAAAPKAPAADDKAPAADDKTPTLGGNIAHWVDKMTSRGITWEKQGAKESIASLSTLNWFGDHRGATFSAPSFTAGAITDTHRGIISLSCNAAGIPQGDISDQVALFTDCITSADLDGIDNAKIRTWIQTTLPAMYGKDGMQVEHLELGTATLSIDTAGNTAAISLEQQ